MKQSYPGFQTQGLAQAAQLATSLLTITDRNARVRALSSILTLLRDADKALVQSQAALAHLGSVLEMNDQYHELLRAVEDAGVVMVSTTPDLPISLPDEDVPLSLPEEVRP